MVSRETAGSESDGTGAPAEIPDLPDWLRPAGDTLAVFAGLLAGEGVTRGLIGPREVPRLWQRHLLNCAVVADPSAGLVAERARVADVGSGAGLPGLVWALVRPDLQVVLIEPLLRRSTFLSEAVARLGVGDRVEVWRTRAEDVTADQAGFDCVTARAVAPLDRLLGWTAPLLRPGGQLVALKGSSAAGEVVGSTEAAERLGMGQIDIIEVGGGVVDPPTTVVVGSRRAAQ